MPSGSVFVNGGLSVINNSGVSVTGGLLQVGGTNSFDVGLSGGELQLMQPGSFHGRILFPGSAAGSVIDLVSTPVSNVRITPTNPAPGQSGAVLSMTSGTTGQVLAYQLISPGFSYFTAQPDGSGGTYLIATPGVPADMVMRNSGTGALEIYDIGNNALLGAAGMGKVGLDWKVSGFGGFSGRAGEGDMLMRNTNTGALYVYDIANNALISAFSMGAVGLDWAVGGFGNFSGRANETDMIMRNTKTGALYVYDIANNALTSAFSMGTVGLDWKVAGFGTFGANPNESDMLLRNASSGALEVYDIYGNTITSAASVGAVGLDWQVGGIAAASPVGSTAAANGQLGATGQLVQAMAGFGGGIDAGESLNTTALGTDTSQPPLLTTPQHA